jgi:hypothetical protein
MAWTQADIDALKSAMGRGLKRARINGEEVEYASTAEMKSVLSMMEAEVAGSSRSTVSVVYPYTTRGL